MKSFGKKNSIAPAVREQFEFTVMRDDEPETHTFNARVITDIAALTFTLGNAERHPDRAMTGMMRMIAKMLDNKDGTPARWAPSPLGPPAIEMPDGEEPDETPPVKFRGPDGQLYTMDHADKFTAFDAGSSRRRWLYLMEVDDEVIVDAADLAKLFEWLVGLAAGRPTQPPA